VIRPAIRASAASVIRSAARRAALPSRTARSSKASATSSIDQSATKLRWVSVRVTRRSDSSRRNASRTGVRDTPQRSARASSASCAPAGNSPDRIMLRIAS
jgi:hypothetical protein